MRRLYLTVYLALVLSLAIFAVLVAAVWLLRGEESDWWQDRARAVGEFVAEAVPSANAPPGELESWLTRTGARFSMDIAVFDAAGHAVAATGQQMAPPEPGLAASRFERSRAGLRADIALPDGRWLVAFRAHDGRGGGKWLVGLALLAVAVGIGAYPLARRITGRVERLQRRVEALGRGDLAARVAVEGKDEIAELARSFNRAAERIEGLVGAQRMLLASASHELRSPLARIRMGVELLEQGQRESVSARLVRDVEELDELIEELLFASRLQTTEGLVCEEPVDLLALIAEECARVDATVEGVPVTVAGDPRWLRRLVRNLLENARRHGRGAAVRAILSSSEDRARLVVEDEGPGVAPSERERIFEPFYRPSGMAEGEDRGVGLGLALVRGIARRHGGDAVCEGREGGGTRFVVDLGRAA